MRADIARREVAYDAVSGTLTVGARTVVVDGGGGGNEGLLRTYLGLVAEQREVTLGSGVHLRRDDVAVLAELLDLDDVDLVMQLRRILHLSDAEAVDLHRRLLRQKLAAAAVGVGLLAGVPATAVVASADEGGSASATTVTTVEVQPSADAIDRPVVVDEVPPPIVVMPAVGKVAVEPEPQPAVEAVGEPAPAPVEEPQVDVGYTVTYEQDPTFVPEEGVDIGTSLVIERDAPPAG